VQPARPDDFRAGDLDMRRHADAGIDDAEMYSPCAKRTIQKSSATIARRAAGIFWLATADFSAGCRAGPKPQL
jgi:hypothetical protein